MPTSSPAWLPNEGVPLTPTVKRHTLKREARTWLYPLWIRLDTSQRSFKRFFEDTFAFRLTDTFVDVGAKYGKWARVFSSQVAKVILVDLGMPGYESELYWAKRSYLHDVPNSRYVQADVTRFPFASDSIDKILCAEVLEHVPDPSVAFTEIQRSLKPGGIAVITTPCSTFINAYEFPVTRLARRLLPQRLQTKPLLRLSWPEWEKLVGHVRRGFTVDEMCALGRDAGLEPIRFDYLHKHWGAYHWELMMGVPWLALASLPLLPLAYAWDRRLDAVGMDLMVAFQKPQVGYDSQAQVLTASCSN